MVISLVFVLVLGAVTAAWSPPCAPCTCYQDDSSDGNFRTAKCRRPNMTSFPALPQDTQYIYISGGKISSLKGTQFNEFQNLTHIFVEENLLTNLPDYLFFPTPYAVEISFEFNKIKKIQSNLFSNLKHLQKVWLEGNQITVIEDHSFINVPQLKYIDFGENLLHRINENFIDDLSSLNRLYFTNNPVHCDETICELMNLGIHRKMWIYNDKEYIPICGSPGIVQGKQWPEAVELLWGKGIERCPRARICSRSTPKHHLTEGLLSTQYTTIAEFPYQVSVKYFNHHICSGSILDEYTILTAAHCIYGKSVPYLTIQAGSTSNEQGGQWIQVDRVVLHEKYNSLNQDYDISIIKLKSGLSWETNVHPAVLQKTDEGVAAGTSAVVSGWGEASSAPELLRRANVQVLAADECRRLYPNRPVTDRMLCCSSDQQDSCQGDSGGPLTVGQQLIGVVSWSVGCGNPLNTCVYANVSAFSSWIHENI